VGDVVDRGENGIRQSRFRGLPLRFDDVAVKLIGFDRLCDAVHHGDRFHGIRAGRGLGGKHHRIGAFETAVATSDTSARVGTVT